MANQQVWIVRDEDSFYAFTTLEDATAFVVRARDEYGVIDLDVEESVTVEAGHGADFADTMYGEGDEPDFTDEEALEYAVNHGTIDLGPVANEDGSPSEQTLAILRGE